VSGVDLVIFDNDGVVVDSEVLANGVLADLLTELGHPTTLEQSIDTYLGGTLAGVRSIVEARSGPPLPGDFEDTYHRRLFAAFDADLRAVPGVRAVLEGLAAPYCLASSGTRHRIVRSLTITGLLAFFADRIFSAQDVAHGKPAPDLFLHAASHMGVAPGRCVVIEDSANGVEAARAAGMRVLGYAAVTPVGRLQGADATFASMDELPPLLDALLA
jgi:HAD superfamily hydrolase (TIGR01509 family)